MALASHFTVLPILLTSLLLCMFVYDSRISSQALSFQASPNLKSTGKMVSDCLRHLNGLHPSIYEHDPVNVAFSYQLENIPILVS